MVETQNWRLHAIVEGTVQGVGFRFYALEAAEKLDLTGWVRNRWDDAVEVIAEGPRPALEKLLAALQRGPRAAYVSTVQQDWEKATGEFRSFTVKPTA